MLHLRRAVRIHGMTFLNAFLFLLFFCSGRCSRRRMCELGIRWFGLVGWLADWTRKKKELTGPGPEPRPGFFYQSLVSFFVNCNSQLCASTNCTVIAQR